LAGGDEALECDFGWVELAKKTQDLGGFLRDGCRAKKKGTGFVGLSPEGLKLSA
jgi:hypothetical protein